MKRKIINPRQKKIMRKRKLHSWIKRLFQLSFLAGVFAILAIFVTAFVFKDDIYSILDQVDEKVTSVTEQTFKNKVETVIYDNKGEVLTKIAPHDYYYLDFKDIPKYVHDATVAIEDVRYYEHGGYDIKAIGRAGIELIKNRGEITQGGSTLTQQLIKLELLTLDQTYKRKILEILIAAKLEKKFDKEKILEFYLNNINYSNGAYGIGSASRYYFNKPAQDLTLSESAFLAAIPNNPSKYNPVRNIDNTLARRNLILEKMKEYKMITDEEYFEAISQKITLDIQKRKTEPESYEISYALSSATKLIMEKQGFEFKYWFKNSKERAAYLESYNEKFLELSQKIRNGGYEIHTTIDMNKQKMLQDSINQGLAGYKTKNPNTGLYEMQGSAVTIDNETGDVVAIIGGRTQNEVHNTFNRAFLSHRQPGSIIKPLIVYTPAFQSGMLASSVMVDKKLDNGPENATGLYLGSMSLQEAIGRSVNTIPHQLGERIGPLQMLKYLQEMEFAHLTPQDNQVSIAYGGFTYGSNTLEMASAYAAIANNGEFIKPTGISKIIDIAKQEAVYENEHTSKKIYDSGAANLMIETMQSVVRQRYGTAYGYGLSNMPTAAKTGTTNSYLDKWFAGVTPYYTTVVWVGYDTPKSIGVNDDPSRTIWKNYSQKLHQELPKKEFKRSDRISLMFKNPKTGEVSKDNNHGYQQELVPEIYYEKQQERFIAAEKRRVELAKQEELNRKEEKSKLLASYNLTEKDLLALQSDVEKSLVNLSYLEIQSKEDMDKAERFIKIAKSNIAAIPIEVYRQPFYNEYNKQVNRLDLMENNYFANLSKTTEVDSKKIASNTKVKQFEKVNNYKAPDKNNSQSKYQQYKQTESRYKDYQNKETKSKQHQINEKNDKDKNLDVNQDRDQNNTQNPLTEMEEDLLPEQESEDVKQDEKKERPIKIFDGRL